MKKLLAALILLCSIAQADPGKKNILVLELSQTHFTVDIWTHIKDSANAVTIEIPVDKEFYDSVSVGDNILKDNFRKGSFFVHGSIGNWNLKVKEKK